MSADKPGAKRGKRWSWWKWALLILGLLASLGYTVLAAGAAIVDVGRHQWAAAYDPAKETAGAIVGFAGLVFILIKYGVRGVQEGLSFELRHYDDAKKRLEQAKSGLTFATASAATAEAAAAEAEAALAVDPANPNAAQRARSARAHAVKLAQQASQAGANLAACEKDLAHADTALEGAYPNNSG